VCPQGPGQPVCAGVELGIGPPHAAADGCDVVRVRGRLLLEQLVEPAVRQVPARPGQALDLEPDLIGGQQALPRGVGIRVGGDQPERGDVVARPRERRGDGGTDTPVPPVTIATRWSMRSMVNS